jgi:hypothetical protein
MADLKWTDADGSQALFTTDDETCGDALAVMAIPVEFEGGVYMTARNARDLIRFLERALKVASDD